MADNINVLNRTLQAFYDRATVVHSVDSSIPTVVEPVDCEGDSTEKEVQGRDQV